MPTLTETSTKFDQYMRNSFDHLAAFVPEDEANQARGEFTRIQTDIQALARKRYAIQSSTELTQTGKIARLKTLNDEAVEVEKSWAPVREKLADFEAAILAHEDAGNGGMVPSGSYGFVKAQPTDKRSPEELALEREIRDRLYDMKRSAVMTLYLNAVEADNDPDLVRAIERAPKAFPLVTEEARTQAKDLRIARSPFAARLKELRNLENLYRTFLEAAQRSLQDLQAANWP